jgi:hypothetical protein
VTRSAVSYPKEFTCQGDTGRTFAKEDFDFLNLIGSHECDFSIVKGHFTTVLREKSL